MNRRKTSNQHRHKYKVLIMWIGEFAKSVKAKAKIAIDKIADVEIEHFSPTINEDDRQDTALISNMMILSREFRNLLEDNDSVYIVGEFSKPGICSYIIPSLMIATKQSIKTKLVCTVFQDDMPVKGYLYGSLPFKLSSWMLYLHRFRHVGIKMFIDYKRRNSDAENEIADYLIKSIPEYEPRPIKRRSYSGSFEEISSIDHEHANIHIAIGKTPIEAMEYARELDISGNILLKKDFLGITSSSESISASFQVLRLYNRQNGITFPCDSYFDQNNSLLNYVLYEDVISNFLSNYEQVEISCDLDDEDSIECLLALVKTLRHDRIKISRVLCVAAPMITGRRYNRPSGQTAVDKLKKFIGKGKIKVLVDPFEYYPLDYNPAEKRKMLALAILDIPYFKSIRPYEEIHTEYDFSFNSIRLLQFIESRDLAIRSYSFSNKQLDFICKKKESVFAAIDTPFIQNSSISQLEWREYFETGKANIIEQRCPDTKEEISPQDLIDRIWLHQADLMFVVNPNHHLMRYAFYWYLSGEDLGLYCMYIQNQKRYRVLNKSNYSLMKKGGG